MIETERLVLRPHVYEDLEGLARVYADAEVRAFLGGDRLDRDRTAFSLGRFMQMQTDRGYSQWAAVEKSTGDYVGRIGLLHWPEWDEVEVGWTLGRWAWGRGYATEGGAATLDWAFANLEVPYVICCIAPDNVASLAVKDRLGLRFDRSDLLLAGTDREVAVEVFRMDRADWLARGPAGSGRSRTA